MDSKAATAAFIGSSSSTSARSSADARMHIAEGVTEVAHSGRLLYKLQLVFLSLSLVPLLFTGFKLVQVGDNYIQNQIRGVKLEIAQKVADNVSSYLEDKKNTLQIVHKSSDFLTMQPRHQTEILSNLMNSYPMFMRLTVIDLDGNEVTTVNRMGESHARARRSYGPALKAIRAMGDFVSPVSRSPEGYPQMTIGVPIERIPGRPVGVLLGTVNLIDLSSLVKDIVIGKSGYVYIVDMARKQLVAHPEVQTLLTTDTPTEVEAASSRSLEELASGAFEFKDQAGHSFLATYVSVPRLKWRVFVQQPLAEAYQASTEMRRQMFLLLIVVALATLGLGFGISHMIVKRVTTLRAAMEQVGEGNFDIPSVPTSNDEFGVLTEKFLWMARSLKDKTLKLVSAQKELQTWNSELERRVEERTRALREAQDQLIAHEKLAALGQMASVVGHELRNPLAVMNNSVYFLKTKLSAAAGAAGLDAKIEKHLSIIESEITKSNTIIRDVLDFARNRALNAAPQKLDELVEKAIERITLPTGVVLKKTLELGALEVPVDEDELRQVLVNLMENACQAMTSGGTLMVGTKTQGSYAAITIGDSGCGIPQEHLAKIFAPFFTTKSRGTGLGLAVVKKIIERHQGFIDVQSKVGEGTRFEIRLPLKGIAAPPEAQTHG